MVAKGLFVSGSTANNTRYAAGMLQHLRVYGLWTTIGCSPTFLSARAANGERSWSS